MYTFDLDPQTIRNIRTYNRGKEYDDYNLSCDSNGRKCISSVIRNNFGMDNSNSTCASQAVNKFDKCQYEG